MSARFDRVMQTKFGEEGNCFAACLASVLGLEIKDVPDVMDTPSRSWFNRLRHWLQSRGWTPVILMCSKLRDLLEDVVVIAGGQGPRGLMHSVLWCNGKVVHDPHPDGTGLVGEPEDFLLIVALDMRGRVRGEAER